MNNPAKISSKKYNFGKIKIRYLTWKTAFLHIVLKLLSVQQMKLSAIDDNMESFIGVKELVLTRKISQSIYMNTELL